MSQETNIRQLIINKLTDAQYEQAVKSADELYLTPDDGSGGGTDLPDQTGQSGKFLTTNGSTLSWGSVPAGTVTSVRVQAGTGLSSSQSTAQSSVLNTTISIASGYKLPTTTEWSNKQDALPSQSGNSGKFLTTNGSTLSWATVSTGTSDYSSLTNKPSINSVTLSGNKTSSDLGLQPALATQTVYSAKGSATKVPQITTNNLGQVTSITEVTISQPTVNNATLSLQKNGTTVATFRANSASNVTCNITVPTKTSELTNNSGFITGITANNVTTALGYTPYNSSNPSGYTTNTGTVTSVRVQAGTGLSSSTSTAQNTTLNTTISIASGYKLPTTTEWSNKQDKLTAQTAYTSKGTATKVPQITTNTLGQVTGITEVDITHPTELPSQTGQSGKFLTTNGSTVSWAATSTNIDNSTITKNGSNQIQTVGYKDVRTSNTLKTWTGTRAQYDAIVTKDANTLYNITDDTDTTAAMLELLYPVGAVYIGTMDVCPLATLGIGSWEKIASDQVLQGSSLNHNAGTTIAAGLPNITGSINRPGQNNNSGDSTTNYLTGSFYFDSSTYSRRNASESGTGYLLKFDASRSNSIYGNSSTVQPPAFVVNIWRRIS